MKDGDFALPAQTDEQIFTECAERLKIAIEAEQENRHEGLLDRRFRYGEQWPQEVMTSRTLDERPALTINLTDTFCRRVENNLRQQRPRIKVHPVDGGADIKTAEVVEGLVRHIETVSDAQVAYDTAGSNAIDIGWGYIRVLTEYLNESSFDQELKVRAVRNTLSGYIDPASVLPNGSDMRWFIFAETMKRDEYKRLYPRKDEPKEFTRFEDGKHNEWDNKETIRLAEYFRIYERPERLFKMIDGTSKFESDLPAPESQVAAGYTIAKDEQGGDISRLSSRRVVQWFRIDGRAVVDRRELKGKYIPVVRVEGTCTDIGEGKTLRCGMVRNFRDPQRMFNYWETMRTERYALAPKAPWVAAEGQVEDHAEWGDANRRNYSTLVYKPVETAGGTVLPPPQRQAPVPVEAGMADAAMSAERNLMAVAGMPQEGADGSRVVSGNKYLQRRQTINDLTHFQFYDNQSQAIAHVGRILLEQVPFVYDTKRMQRIIGIDGTPSVVQLNDKSQEDGVNRVANDVTVGTYDVVMDAGPGYQTLREEGAEQMLALLDTRALGEIIAKAAPDTVVRSLSFAGAQELADRLIPMSPEGMDKAIQGLPQQAKSIIAGLQTKLKQADDLIQQQHLEIKYKRETEDAWIAFERYKTDKQDSTKRYDTTTKADATVAVAEIHGATQLLNTNTEAGHDRAAAREMIDRGQDAAARH